MTTRVMNVRFYGAAKRLSPDPWAGGLLPVDEIEAGLAALNPPNDAIVVNGQTIVGRVRSSHADYAHVVFYRIRDDLLPALRNSVTGDIEELLIDDEDALAEATEVLLCRNGLVVQLVNRDGPGITTISIYIEKATGVDAVMVALVHDDALEQLGQSPDLSAVKIRAARGSAEELGRGHASLREAGLSADRAPGTKSVELIYRAEPGRRERFRDTWMPRIRRLAGEPGIERLTVFAYDEEARRTDEIDLLLDKITTRAFVELTSDNRYITADAALVALLDAYDAMRYAVSPALRAVIAEEAGDQ